MDKSEFEKQLAKYSRFVELYVYRKTPNKFDGDDIIQEVYMAAYKGYRSLNSNNNFKSWLLSIAHNKCADYYRHRHPDTLEITAAENIAAPESTILDEVHETLDKLPKNCRQLLVEYYILGRKQHELAAKYNCPLGTIKSRLYSAKNKFRNVYPIDQRKECDNMHLPNLLPETKISRLNADPFEVVCTQYLGYFISPVLGEKCIFADYDFNKDGQLEKVFEEHCRVSNKAIIHGVDCIEIQFENGRRCMSRFLRLTNTHLQTVAFLSRRNTDGQTRLHTFLDDEFFGKWGFGEQNCGEEILRIPRGIICEPQPNVFNTDTIRPHNLDICGRFQVTLGHKVFDTVRSVYFNPFGVLVENYIARDGRCVYFRRFDRTEKTVTERSTVHLNGELYEHSCSAIADYCL